MVAAQLICALVFVYAKIRFSHDVAHILVKISSLQRPNTISTFCTQSIQATRMQTK